MNIDERYIKECIELAKFGEGKVSPNPFVGSIVLDKNGNVVGRGYHMKCGEAHAEINALNEAGEKAICGIIYINLEPCSHFGKTPPCADRIISSGVKKVVVGMVDPNPQVAGEGLKKIRAAGIEVTSGILEGECKKLNEIFIKHITNNKPFIAIKTASTTDGKIATRTGSSKWITSDSARAEVQRLRNKYDAILTGSGTVIKDNPSLTCRLEGGRNPVRIIIDSELKTGPNSNVYNNDGTKIFIATSEKAEGKYSENVEIIRCPLTNEGKINLKFLTDELYKKGIRSILVEAGGKLNGAFLKNSLVDKFYFFIAPKILGDNRAYTTIDGFDTENIDQCINLRFDDVKFFSPDLLIEAYT
ncbi:MAG: bifunctional diaminohydroxyphosphoribosylaminopyrimidine deaminase/5-amino-6-(5-phosphoribosylamino)uracil reductase RibD [Candidatus Gastranaerophilales bacterium]|nr:bifunctional diaminohydroxyphosphoribosylaminopyrimidine deaminase/5-amino-6-(5-phosphoribosylamino)uracil reductase RibD [Candidatus Gastranaerophilales bacterium]